MKNAVRICEIVFLLGFSEWTQSKLRGMLHIGGNICPIISHMYPIDKC